MQSHWVSNYNDKQKSLTLNVILLKAKERLPKQIYSSEKSLRYALLCGTLLFNFRL